MKKSATTATRQSPPREFWAHELELDSTRAEQALAPDGAMERWIDDLTGQQVRMLRGLLGLPADGRYPHYPINSRVIAVHGGSYARHATKNPLQISQGKGVTHGHTHRADASLGRRSETLYTIPILDDRCILPDGTGVSA